MGKHSNAPGQIDSKLIQTLLICQTVSSRHLKSLRLNRVEFD